MPEIKFAWDETIQISALYSLPHKGIDNWWPFSQVLPECAFAFSFDQEAAIRSEGRLVVKTLAHVSGGSGGCDDCSLMTVWFDGKPFAVFRLNGSGGGERWVTHPKVLCEAIAYLAGRAAEMLDGDDIDDYAAPELMLPVDEVFVGLLEAQFIEPEAIPPADERFMTAWIHDELEQEESVIMSKTDSPPELLRRGKAFLRFVRSVTETEAVNAAKLLAPDSPYLKKGFAHVFEYRDIPRPENYREAVAF